MLKDVGMEMRVMGAPAYYPLIEAGKNWYECKAGCELILDDITELVFVAGTFGEKHKKKVLVVSADVYRPAAIKQLETLAEQVGVDFFPSDVRSEGR